MRTKQKNCQYCDEIVPYSCKCYAVPTHTPTPWEVAGDNLRHIVAEDGTMVGEALYFSGDGARNDDPYSNAAYIVKAVNCHAALVKTLGDALRWGESEIRSEYEGTSMLKSRLKELDFIRIAIAQVEGE